LKITGIIWLRSVIDKLEHKHQLDQLEVEEIFYGHPRFRRIARGDVAGEDLYSAMGQTDTGRYLVVFFVYKRSREALVISARDMSRKERRRYDKK
jgi:uncharacterized DUF497 family protein